MKAFKGTKIGKAVVSKTDTIFGKVTQYNSSFKSSITRARNAWNDGRKVIKLTYKMFRNGFLDQLGKKIKNVPIKYLKELLFYNVAKFYTKDVLSDFIDEIYLANCIG